MSESKKKGISGLGLVVVFIVVGTLLLCLISSVINSGGGSTSTRSSSASRPTTYSIVYVVSGTPSQAGVTYANRSGNTEQKDPIALTWRYEFTAMRGQFLYVSAQQNSGADSATVQCSIRVNNATVETASSKGGYTIATCSGSAGD